MRTAILLVACAVALPRPGAAEALGHQVAAEVTSKHVGSWGSHPGHVNHPRHTTLATLDSGAERYGLRYSCCPHPSHAPGVATPEGYIGMPMPSSVNWYHNGFLRIVVNGKDIGTTPLAAFRRSETGRRGSVQLVWRRDDADVRATFLMLPGDPTLYFEAAAYPKKGEVQSLGLALTAYPVAYRHDVDRWAITPRRGIQQDRREQLDPTAESWVLCQDHALERKGDNPIHPGGCGLQFLPAEVGEATARVHTYPVHIDLAAKPGVHRVHLAIWDFHKQSNREAERWVRARAKATAERLASLDFSNPILRGEDWPPFRARLLTLLPAAKGYPKLHDKAKRHIEQVDARLAQLRQATAKGTAPPLDAEDKLLVSLDALYELRWEIELVALFAE